MGTDIHVQVEVRIDGKWQWIGKFLPFGVRKFSPIPTDRCYNLFGILADVRNGKGFAGVDLGDGFRPISKPKGLPSDIDKELLEYHQKEGILGEHSFSYLTAREIKDYDWKQYTYCRGVLSEQEYVKWDGKSMPDSYSGSVSGQNIVTVSSKEMDMILSNRIIRDDTKEYYVKVSWRTSYEEAVPFSIRYPYQNLFYEIIDYDVKNITPDDVRIVFGFDS